MLWKNKKLGKIENKEGVSKGIEKSEKEKKLGKLWWIFEMVIEDLKRERWDVNKKERMDGKQNLKKKIRRKRDFWWIVSWKTKMEEMKEGWEKKNRNCENRETWIESKFEGKQKGKIRGKIR